MSQANLLDNDAVEGPAIRQNRRLGVLLWASWACAVWFVTGVSLSKFAGALPHWLEIGMALSGAVTLLGRVLAALYLVSSVWFVTRWKLGAVALLVNAALAWLFVASLPG